MRDHHFSRQPEDGSVSRLIIVWFHLEIRSWNCDDDDNSPDPNLLSSCSCQHHMWCTLILFTILTMITLLSFNFWLDSLLSSFVLPSLLRIPSRDMHLTRDSSFFLIFPFLLTLSLVFLNPFFLYGSTSDVISSFCLSKSLLPFVSPKIIIRIILLLIITIFFPSGDTYITCVNSVWCK